MILFLKVFFEIAMNSNKASTPKTSNEYVKIISELKIAKTNINKTKDV